MRLIRVIFFTAMLATIWPVALCNGQTVDASPDATVVQTNPLNDEESAFRELTIAVATDLDSPVHAQAVIAINQQSIISDRFNTPIREAVETGSTEPYNESRLLAAVTLMPFSTIPRQEQIALLLDTLVILSNRETPFGLQLRAGLLNDGPRSSVLLNSIVAQLSAKPEGLAAKLENRFKQGKQPAVVYSVLPLTNNHGTRLMPYMTQASSENDRFVRSSVFIALRKVFTNAESESVELMKRRFMSDAKKIFFRNDVDQNRILTTNEWKTMLVNPADADVDGDGKITLDEYVDWFARRKINLMQITP